MQKIRYLLFPATCLLALAASAQDQLAHNLAGPSSAGGIVGCEQTSSPRQQEEIVLTIPHAVFERAKLKSQLGKLLRESLFDDSKGIVNADRERKIKDLANKLRK